MNDATAFILAGGKSSRMGQDKAFLPFAGSTLLERVLATLRAVVSDVRIVGSAERFGDFAPTVEDQFPNCGPLGGIHAALSASNRPLNLIVAVDMPFLEPDFLRYLLDQARASNDPVTIACAENRWQPLCAVYRRAFLSVAESALRARRYRIDDLFSQVNLRAIDEHELAAHNFSSQIFCNLNTPDELERATLVKKKAPTPKVSGDADSKTIQS
jgi:molybdopterin-guanine dinucleotide biosynthesis protein A